MKIEESEPKVKSKALNYLVSCLSGWYLRIKRQKTAGID